MIISHVSDGPKASYNLKGTSLTVGSVTIDLQARQRTTERVIDVCLDNQLQTMREGLSAWYVANIIIPAKRYSLQPAEGAGQDEDEEMVEVELPVDLSQVELRMWGLPAQYFENQGNEDEDKEQGDEE